MYMVLGWDLTRGRMQIILMGVKCALNFDIGLFGLDDMVC